MLQVSILDTVTEPASQVTYNWGSVELRYGKGTFLAHVVYPHHHDVESGKFFITQTGSRQYFDMCIHPDHLNAPSMKLAGHTLKELTNLLDSIPKHPVTRCIQPN
jgi:hypothetical protein